MSHDCPICGKETEGSWSEGGIQWAICEDCAELEKEQHKIDQDMDKLRKEEPWKI